MRRSCAYHAQSIASDIEVWQEGKRVDSSAAMRGFGGSTPGCGAQMGQGGCGVYRRMRDAGWMTDSAPAVPERHGPRTHTSLVTRASPRGKTTCGLKCERCTATALPKPLLCSHPRYSGLGYHGEYIPLYQVALLSMPHAYNALRNRNGTCRNRHCPPASVQDRRPSL